LKLKFSNNWDSVRKAFLALDTDYDGFVTVEDILRNFGNQSSQNKEKNSGSGINFNDLKKLIMEKDSTKRGKLGYTDFSKWVGNCIHSSEGFYFRHDSIKNPCYEDIVKQREQK
jgi:Ca2+-binding EF-hand superfamily protein